YKKYGLFRPYFSFHITAMTFSIQALVAALLACVPRTAQQWPQSRSLECSPLLPWPNLILVITTYRQIMVQQMNRCVQQQLLPRLRYHAFLLDRTPLQGHIMQT